MFRRMKNISPALNLIRKQKSQKGFRLQLSPSTHNPSRGQRAQKEHRQPELQQSDTRLSNPVNASQALMDRKLRV